MQEDSLWLSKETQIDEIAALRIAILEWQTRPADRLLYGSPDDDGPSLSSGTSSTLFQPSLSIPRSSILGKQLPFGGDNRSLDSSQARRRKLLYIYFSERLYILKVSEHVVFCTLPETSSSARPQPDERLEGKVPDRSGWVEELGNKILDAWNLNAVAKEKSRSFIVTAVDALQSRIENLERGCEWLHDENLKGEFEVAWGRNQVLELIHIMRLILSLLNASTKLSQADIFLAWFRFMGKHAFFESFNPVSLESRRVSICANN